MVKQDNNGSTFVISDRELPWLSSAIAFTSLVRIWRPLGVSHGWDNTVKCSFDELAGFTVELVIAIFQAV